METGRTGKWIDNEALERMAHQGGLKPNLRVCMYRLGESRVFERKEDIPAGEGWVDSPALVRPMPQIAPSAAIVDIELASPVQSETLTSESPRRPGRKPRK